MQIDPRTSKTSQRTWQGYCMLLWVIALPCGITLGEKHGWLLPSPQTFLLIKMPLPCANPANPLRTQTAWSVAKMSGSWWDPDVFWLANCFIGFLSSETKASLSLSLLCFTYFKSTVDRFYMYTYALNNSRAFICESYYHIISSIQWQMYCVTTSPN